MSVLRFLGAEAMTVRHRTFAPGEAVSFDMADPADAALYDKCAALPYFEAAAEEAPPPRRRGRRHAQDQR